MENSLSGGMKQIDRQLARLAMYSQVCYGGAPVLQVLKYLCLSEVFTWHIEHMTINKAIADFIKQEDAATQYLQLLSTCIRELAEIHRTEMEGDDTLVISLQLEMQAKQYETLTKYIKTECRQISKGKGGLCQLNCLFIKRRNKCKSKGKQSMESLEK